MAYTQIGQAGIEARLNVRPYDPLTLLAVSLYMQRDSAMWFVL